MIGDFPIIPKIPKGETLSHPTNFLQKVYMGISYGDCIALGGNHCILALVGHTTHYVYTYGMCALSGSDIIQ